SGVGSCVSRSTSVLVDAFGEVLQALAGFLQPAFRLVVRRAEDVAGAQLSVPASKALQVLFFFVEFRSRELLGADLLVDLRVELRALGEELGPFLFALFGEQGFEPCGHALAAR